MTSITEVSQAGFENGYFVTVGCSRNDWTKMTAVPDNISPSGQGALIANAEQAFNMHNNEEHGGQAKMTIVGSLLPESF